MAHSGHERLLVMPDYQGGMTAGRTGGMIDLGASMSDFGFEQHNKVLTDELARVMPDGDEAKMIVLRAGLASQHVPEFKNPLVFWTLVIQAAAAGRICGGVQAIVDEAAIQFPGNALLARYRSGGDRHEVTRRAQATDWLHALGMALPRIVGPDRFERWAVTTFGARPFGDEDESLHDYGLAVVRTAHAAGQLSEAWWHTLMRRYAEHEPELARLFAQWSQSAAATSGSVPPPTHAEASPAPPVELAPCEEHHAEHTAVVLDRTQAWKTLRDGCKHAEGPRAFVVYGTWQQDLDLFMERIESYFHDPQENPVYHHVLRVRMRQDVSNVTSADDWERATIEATRARRGSLGGALASEARRHPVLLLLGGPRPLRSLGPQQRRHLEEFLTRRLPAELQASRPRHHVHVVVPIELPHDDASELVDVLEAAFRERPSVLELQEPERLVLPDWREIRKHVEQSFEHEGLRVSKPALDACRDLYDRIKQQRHAPRLRDLGNPLHHLLYELIEQARGR